MPRARPQENGHPSGRRGAVFAAGVLLLFAVLGFGAPWLAPYDPTEQTDPFAARLRPPGSVLYAVPLEHGRWILGESWRLDDGVLELDARGRTRQVSTVERLDPPDAPPQRRIFLMGSDEFGRDVLSRWLYGARISLAVALTAALLAGVIGIGIGAAAALGPRYLDSLLMRFVDGFLSLPWLFLLIALAAYSPPSAIVLVGILGFTAWPFIARLARSELLALRERDFVHAARGLGMGETRIFFRHILPNMWTPLLVAFALQIGYLISAEASLSFLGLGIQAPAASWGNMIEAGRHHLGSAWWIFGFPAFGLVATVVALHRLADGLRDHLDPRRRASASPANDSTDRA